ncbi:hypothetical protein J8F10_09385 [Gemmata sp. G18]|uniref:Uncharacterized protein n=1 Tax=Gemmata palustris TaxID=2822762 RepID=A0ABS5BP74_9BACT|nr:hypothetical protein [Gemmata palustris]MBP3955493.1 hypothetical protein [Gemmata palustris]
MAETIDRLARQVTGPNPSLIATPLVQLPPGIETLSALMAFDKEQCARYGQFRRPLCNADFETPQFGQQFGMSPGAVGIVTVTPVAPGVRSRVVTEHRRAR